MKRFSAWVIFVLLAGCSSQPSIQYARSGCGSEVVVRSGDTLGEIAQRCRVSLRALAQANGIDPPYMIRIGQRLRIPRGQGAVSTVKQPSSRRLLVKSRTQRLLVWPLPGATVSWKPDPKGGAGMLLRSRKPVSLRAMAAGRVVTLTRLPNYGPVIVIDHGGALYGVYARLQQIRVQTGQQVAAGEPLGHCAPQGADRSVCYVELREERRLVDLRRWRNWRGRQRGG